MVSLAGGMLRPRRCLTAYETLWHPNCLVHRNPRDNQRPDYLELKSTVGGVIVAALKIQSDVFRERVLFFLFFSFVGGYYFLVPLLMVGLFITWAVFSSFVSGTGYYC